MVRRTRVRRTPQRKCIVCATTRDKRELVRLALGADGAIVVDESGKGPGRGAYLCRQRSCWSDPVLMRRLGQTLRARPTAQDMARLASYATRWPHPAATGSAAAPIITTRSGRPDHG
jgi:predicted RNA-binding protein YlxR (DUF448 family)